MAAFRKGQEYEGPYSKNFGESQVQDLGRDAYNPGPTPNKYVANTDGKMKIQLDTDADDRSRSLNNEWHSYGGFSGPVHKTNAGFRQNAGPGGTHPRVSAKSDWPSVGADSATRDQGSVSGTPFKWR